MYRKLVNKRRKAGVEGWIKSQDLDGRGGRIYRNQQEKISARPDVVEGNRLLEFKSAHAGHKARYSDVLQVTAQMIATGLDRAELRYGNNQIFQLRRDTPLIRGATKDVRRISERMHWHLKRDISPKGTPTRNKCSKCNFRNRCSDAM
jgi:CRISPR/Cas system-associated exonuclease Cas4 (RecB family)